MIDRGLTLFDSGYSCAEAVLLAGMERLKIHNDLIPKLASGFAGGVSRTRSLCGALSGGVMVLGAIHGRMHPSDGRDILIARTQDLMRVFRERFGSDNCYTLTQLDFNEPGALDIYRAQVHAHCREYVRVTLELLMESLPDIAHHPRRASIVY
ncbi:MAG: C-GCAxxG-C-C family protein [Vicinamibacteria bacterium]|jgi:C_GCAxxG_C_C family probable redox protein|nr:C-GCAxxG-C-C family protein [Vicinamibacteria bacterium]